MSIPFRYRKLAKVTKSLIDTLRIYKTDIGSGVVSMKETGKDLGDLITVSLSDAGFDQKMTKEALKHLIEDLGSKFDFRE